MINYNNRQFRPTDSSSGGDVDAATIFEYHENHGVVWATYAGGSIQFGTLIAKKAEDGSLDMRYSLVTTGGVFKAGICKTTPEITDDGTLMLHEKWRWTDGDVGSGNSILEEIKK